MNKLSTTKKYFHKHWRDVIGISIIVIALCSLLLIAYGIRRNNQIAEQQRNHIDCIVKLLSTPSKPGQTRRIVDLSVCQIKVSQ